MSNKYFKLIELQIPVPCSYSRSVVFTSSQSMKLKTLNSSSTSFLFVLTLTSAISKSCRFSLHPSHCLSLGLYHLSNDDCNIHPHRFPDASVTFNANLAWNMNITNLIQSPQIACFCLHELANLHLLRLLPQKTVSFWKARPLACSFLFLCFIKFLVRN